MPVENDSSISQVRHFLRELLLGREDPEGFFCLCLSILGHRETRVRFRELIAPLTDSHRQLHSLLLTIYQEYFSKVRGLNKAKPLLPSAELGCLFAMRIS